MNYKVLYRKYRPDTFDNVIEQDYIVKTLKNSIINNKISHAYIFSGPRGTGKTSIAKIFAKAINCLNIRDGNPCNECESCKMYRENPDIIEIDAASNNSVDDVKELINNCKLSPAYSKYKVYIIDEVHMLSSSAFNALLLTLEEPPSHVVFVFATTNIESVPITILSRCQRYDFKKIESEAIKNHIIKIAKTEQIKLMEEAAYEIALLSEGGMRDALGILEQLSSSNEKITLLDVEKYYGVVSTEIITTMINSIITNDINNIISTIDVIKKNNYDYKTFTKKFIRECRNYILKHLNESNYLDKLKTICLDLTINLNKISANLEPYDIIEMIIIDNCKINSDIKSSKIEEKVHIEKKNITFEKVEEDIVIKEEPEITIIEDKKLKIRVNNCLANAKKEYLTTFKINYSSFIEKIVDDKYIYSLLVDTKPVVSSDEIVLLITSVKANVNLINKMISKIEELYENLLSEKHKFYVVSDENWEEIRKEYLNNLKNNVKYTYIEEKDNVKDEYKSEVEKFAEEFFINEKVIIE